MENVQKTIDQGSLEGKTVKTESGFLYDAFLAIPYAKPPLGALRFREPEPAEGWTGIRDATKQANVAAQFDPLFMKSFIGEEDCLYLNVYTPHEAAAGADIPVMFWIHGGGFSSGSGNPDIYGPDLLMPYGVIVVTINYRLGPLGFMCLNTPDCSGNMGLKDQLLALKWVRKNIKNFGGNPENITIFGESAGGASTHHLVLTPLAKGLFNRAIMQSGTTFNEWSIHDKSEKIAFNLGKALGIDTQKKSELLTFLREVPSDKLIMTSISPELAEGMLLGFAPVIEKVFPETTAFITKDPRESVKDGDFNKISTMSGITSKEGILMLVLRAQEFGNFENLTLDKLVPDFEYVIPKALLGKISDEQKSAAAKKIKDFYFSSEENVMEKFIDLQSDFAFVKDIDFSVKMLTKYSSPTYYYRFSYNGSFNLMKYLCPIPYSGASHGDELGYLFKPDLKVLKLEVDKNIQPTEKDILTIRRMTELWTNFAKYGNPTPKKTDAVNVTWEPTSKNDLIFLDIDEQLSLTKNPFEERIKFWENLENSL